MIRIIFFVLTVVIAYYLTKFIRHLFKDLNTKIQEEKIETIVEYGLHQFVTQFIRKISSVDNEIHKEFFN